MKSILANIIGTITDSTGTVVSGAKVTLTNVNSNERREFANNFGKYEINNLLPGVYVLEADMAGSFGP